MKNNKMANNKPTMNATYEFSFDSGEYLGKEQKETNIQP
jgi:hypothetical protein